MRIILVSIIYKNFQPTFPAPPLSVSPPHVPAVPPLSLPLPLEGVEVGHGVHGGLGVPGVHPGVRHQGLLGVHGAAGQGRQARQLHPREAGLAQLLPAQVGLDEVDLVVDPLLHGGAVPPPLSELVLALVYGPHRPQSHRVHEARIPLAELHLKIKSIRNVSTN